MKRRALIQYLEKLGCLYDREGANHTIYINPVNNKRTSVPRHNEIVSLTVRKICRELGILIPEQK